jgi:hypothetical protein
VNIQPVHRGSCHCGTVVFEVDLPRGIYTHHLRRSNPNQYGFNVACLEGVDPFARGEIPVVDGSTIPVIAGPLRRGLARRQP